MVFKGEKSMLKNVAFKIWFGLLLAVNLWAGEYVLKGDAIALTTPGEFYKTAQWSPRGDQLAAAGQGYNSIYLITFPTGEARQLAVDPSAGYGFSWSHDGSRIASRVAQFNNMRRSNTLVSFNILDGKQNILSATRSIMVGTPRWSADDSQIYLTDSEAFELFNTGSSTGSQAPIFYVKEGRMTFRDLSRGVESVLFQDQDKVTSYAIAPDGSQIAYSTSGQKLWVAQSSGENVRSLGSGLAPSWSPDGAWVTYMLPEDDGHSILASDIYIIPVDGSARKKLTDTPDLFEMNPQWSPDGSWIVFDTYEQGQLLVQQLEWR